MGSLILIFLMGFPKSQWTFNIITGYEWRTQVLRMRFYLTGVFHVLNEPGHLVSSLILCPLGPGVLRGSKNINRLTVLIQKEPVSWSFFTS